MKKISELISKKSPWTFIIFFGIISLFSDMTHEGARAITGQYLSTLGASATIVGFVAGFGEFIGYAFRLFSGVIADKTRKYWTITIIGYLINLLAVPALALAGSWETAAVLMILERAGRAIRNPSRDVMLSHATSSVGQGKGFGVHEALDQIGAVIGPSIVSIVYLTSGDYSSSFSILLIPAILAIIVLVVTRSLFPKTERMEVKKPLNNTQSYKKFFWVYLIAISLIAAGFADFPLIAFHFQKSNQVTAEWIPALYALAMAVDAISALILGRYYDKYGIKIMIISTILSLLFAPLVFMGSFHTAIVGMICWGIGMGAQESIVRAVLATVLPIEKRATGFGVFNSIFGLFWFLGSFLMGRLYDISIYLLVVFSIIIQLFAIPLFIYLVKTDNSMVVKNSPGE